jgi:hypothetical protein
MSAFEEISFKEFCDMSEEERFQLALAAHQAAQRQAPVVTVKLIEDQPASSGEHTTWDSGLIGT